MVPTQMDYIHIISNASLMVKFVLLLLLFFVGQLTGIAAFAISAHARIDKFSA